MPSLIQDLLNPAALPDRTKSVSLVQTHISLVFIADEYVYKIKKPVDFGFLDFTSLKKREHYCHQEISLNQRLAEDVYIEVLPVTFDGMMHKIGIYDGETVEYAVKMKRIPDDRLMRALFHRGELREGHLKEIARVLARFHQNAEHTSEIEHFGRPEVFKVNTDENFEQTRKYTGKTITKEVFDDLFSWTDKFYKDKTSLFLDRISGKKIRNCHGDLHMEHVCLTDKLAIIDCIEFNDRFRYSDTIADIAFLIMDLEYQGGAGYADRLWSYYVEETGDIGMDELLTFYKVYRAYVRGKVISFQLDDKNIGPKEKEKAIEAASKYFMLARSYIQG